jgi:hypothetical protein
MPDLLLPVLHAKNNLLLPLSPHRKYNKPMDRLISIALHLGALLLCALPVAATAADMKVAGLTLGDPLFLPECGAINYPNISTETCQMEERAIRSGWKITNVFLGRDVKPAMIVSMRAYLRGELLVAVQFTTNGFDTQFADFNELVEKYGKPASRKIERFQNGFGAKFEGVLAIWRPHGLLIQFNGIYGDRKTGLVTIATPEGIELVNAGAEKLPRSKGRL